MIGTGRGLTREDPRLFAPERLEARQWARAAGQAMSWRPTGERTAVGA
jgi:hypothetical protein